MKWLWLTLALGMLFLLTWATNTSHAQTHHHEGQTEEVDRFYSTWMQPDDRAKSCCHKVDCAPAEAKTVDGQWYARQVGSWKWLPVPPSKIEHDRDNPDGRNHLCASIVGSVYCFILGSGT